MAGVWSWFLSVAAGGGRGKGAGERDGVENGRGGADFPAQRGEIAGGGTTWRSRRCKRLPYNGVIRVSLAPTVYRTVRGWATLRAPLGAGPLSFRVIFPRWLPDDAQLNCVKGVLRKLKLA
jgi:hypothetical protein